MEGSCITHKSERLDDTTIAAGEEQEKVDISSDEENPRVSFALHTIFIFFFNPFTDMDTVQHPHLVTPQ